MVVELGMLKEGTKFMFLNGRVEYVFLGVVKEQGFNVGEYRNLSNGKVYTALLNTDVEV